MKDMPVRKSIRLHGYDYSRAGYYFVTICIKDKHEILWEEAPVGAHIVRPLSGIGKVVKKAVENITQIYGSITVDKYSIMPNHIHMILRVGGGGRTMCAPTTISNVIKQIHQTYILVNLGVEASIKICYSSIRRRA